MARPARLPAPNRSHNVLKRAQRRFELDVVPTSPRPSLLLWAELYLQRKVLGAQAANTEQAKRRDLRAFLEFFAGLNL